MWKIKEVNVFMKTILKRTIVFFLSLAMIISVACSTAVAAETLEDQNVTSHGVSYIIYKEDGTVKETGTLAQSSKWLIRRIWNFIKRQKKQIRVSRSAKWMRRTSYILILIQIFHDFPPFLRSLRFIDNFKRMRMFLYTLNIYHA